MNRTLKALLIVSTLAISTATIAAAEPPDLAPRFADQMVLQHGVPVVVDGTATPGASVTVSLGSVSAVATAEPSGTWSATLEGQPPGRSLTLAAATSEGAVMRHDIHIGDVFLCSGQSNMAHPVANALNPSSELSGPFPADLRLVKIPQQSSVSQQATLPPGSNWKAANSETVSGFSAICYFFGRDHAMQTGLPVGLIDSSWGGSRIEAWISPAGLAGDASLAEGLELLSLYSENPVAAQMLYGRAWEAWWTARANDYAPWHTGLATPKPVPGDLRDWKQFGDPELDTHLGLVWFERTLELDAGIDPGSGILSLGGMDEIDTVWVNGEFTGTTFGWGTPRTYFVPAGVLKPGANRITIGVYNAWGAGGMTGPEDALTLTLHNGGAVPLSGRWTYEKVASEYGAPPAPPWQSISGLSGLHNAMIAPLSGLRFAGALWYQGESNTGEPERYEDLLHRLAADLRRQFGDSLPLLVFQLPEFGPRAYAPVESGWSGLRDAQRRFVTSDPASGLIVALGAGDPWDIHPPNKQEPARRARAVWQAIGTAGPQRTGYSPESVTRRGDTITITLPEASEPYRIAGSEEPVGFSICDSDGACRFSRALLKGRIVELPKASRRAAFVRYCWGDTPTCNLVSPDGVPVTPFELELP